MFRKRTGQAEPSKFDAGVLSTATYAAEPGFNQVGQQQQRVGDTIAAIRQNSRRRSSDPAADSSLGTPRSGHLTPVRARVQQPLGRPHVLQQLAPLPQQQAHRTPTSTHGLTQGYSVFSNPLSSHTDEFGDPAGLTASARGPASLEQLSAADQAALTSAQAAEAALPAPAADLQQHAEEDHPVQQPTSATSAIDPHISAESTAEAVDAGVDAATEAKAGQLKHASLLAGKALRFEVSAAGDYDSHDQELLDGEHMQPDDGVQQQYVYDEDTGQLMRVGEGADTTRLARHYLEDWNTGEFFQLAQSSSRCSCLAWLRRKPTTGPSWGTAAQEPSVLRSLAEFTDNMGSAMAAVGMFAQGLGGGLALLCLFMTYLQYATAGIDGFLAYYSAHAQMVNRAFSTLISLSLVSAASRLAYDKLGSFQPAYLRLKLVDGLVMCLYLIAYLCNLIATPTDDQLTYEARRDLSYYALPMQPAFLHKVTLWHVLNLIRIVCCGLAWALVCYRGNPYVMMMVFEARKQQQAEVATGRSVGPAAHMADGSRQQHQAFVTKFLAGEGSNLGNAGAVSGSLFNTGSGLPAVSGEVGGGYSTAGAVQYSSSTGKQAMGRMAAASGSTAGNMPLTSVGRTSSLPAMG